MTHEEPTRLLTYDSLEEIQDRLITIAEKLGEVEKAMIRGKDVSFDVDTIRENIRKIGKELNTCEIIPDDVLSAWRTQQMYKDLYNTKPV
jgi:hypothetical protein